VEETSLECFAHGHSIRVRRGLRCIDRCEVVERARSRLGERRYRVLSNNCEHFCAWALRDEYGRGQVERLRATPRALCRAIVTQYEGIERNYFAVARALRAWWEEIIPRSLGPIGNRHSQVLMRAKGCRFHAMPGQDST
jgi:hypothetical protein